MRQRQEEGRERQVAPNADPPRRRKQDAPGAVIAGEQERVSEDGPASAFESAFSFPNTRRRSTAMLGLTPAGILSPAKSGSSGSSSTSGSRCGSVIVSAMRWTGAGMQAKGVVIIRRGAVAGEDRHHAAAVHVILQRHDCLPRQRQRVDEENAREIIQRLRGQQRGIDALRMHRRGLAGRQRVLDEEGVILRAGRSARADFPAP